MHHFSCERGPNLIRDCAARVGVGLPARPCCTVKPRQQGLDFPETVPIVLAWASPQGLVLPSSHANKDRNFPCRRCSCWRGPPWKALLHRQATPTGARFSSAGVARVGVGLPGRPCCTVKPRQQEPEFPAPAPPMLAWASLEGLVLPSSHANKAWNFPCRRCSCWRQPLCKVLIHRQAAPTGTGISRDGAARVGVGLPGRPCCTVKPRQQGLNFPETVPLVLAWAFPQGLVSPSSHANKALIFPRRSCCRRINPSAFSGNSRTLWCLPSR